MELFKRFRSLFVFAAAAMAIAACLADLAPAMAHERHDDGPPPPPIIVHIGHVTRIPDRR